MTLADEGGVLGHVVVTLTPAGQPATTHTTLMPWAEARSWRARCDGKPYWVCPVPLARTQQRREVAVHATPSPQYRYEHYDPR